MSTVALSPSRRAVLAGAAVLASTAAAMVMPTSSASQGHPDAALLALWERYAAACRTLQTLPVDADREPVWKVIEHLRDQIKATPPIGRTGVGIHLRVVLIDLAGFDDVTVDSFGGPTPESIAGDNCLEWLWDLAALLGGHQEASATTPV